MIKLFSKLDYPVSVKYGDTEITIPARAFALEVQDEKKLGDLPTGVQKVLVKKDKEVK